MMYAATINARSMVTSTKKVVSSLTVPFGRIANSTEEQKFNNSTDGYGPEPQLKDT